MITPQNLSAAEQMFRDFLASNGHPIDGEINHNANKFHYLKCPQGSANDARYKFYSDGIASGYLKCWHCNIEDDFCSRNQHEVTPEEWNAHLKRLAVSKQQEAVETQKKHAEVAALAKAVYSNADEVAASEHDYLRSKQVKNYGLRVLTKEDENTKKAECYKGTLLVPCYNADELVNLERIYFDKKENKYQKRPLTSGQRSGAYYLIGEVSEQQEIFLLAEGVSTGATVYEAMGFPTAITFNCGNIINVVKILSKKYPQAQIVIATDDDRWKDDPKLRNSGLKSANKACASVNNAVSILPDFSVLGLPDEKLAELKPTDFNDLFVHLMKKGLNRNAALEIIRQQLTFQPTPHAEILAQLITRITPIDFRKLAELTEAEKLHNKHFQIIAIEQVLELAKANNWGICKNYEFIYLFNGEYWSLVDEEELKTFLGSAAEAMGVDKFSARYFNFRDQLYKQFMALANLPKPEQPKNVVHINLKNGTFEITPDGMCLKPFNRSDFITYQLPFEHCPKATAPLFTAYLNRVLPEKELQHILAEYLGYVFIHPSTLKLEKTLLLYGTGANGKSVFYEIVRSLLGDQNTSEYSLQSLTNENGYFRAMIANKLVNYASEINGKLEASIFKQLVSGEPVEARLPYGKPFTLKQYAKLIFNCNELPKDVEQTEAYFRRFLIIPFKVTIPEAEQDRQLAQKIISTELSGVFNWVLQGLKRLLEKKHFTECVTVNLAREQYEKESDSVKLFVEEYGYKPNITRYTTISILYSQYRTFCIDDGFKPVNKTNFIKRLESSRIVVERKNVGKVAFLTQDVEEYKNFG
jgi:P4 family phage/plasmid primase-like protien